MDRFDVAPIKVSLIDAWVMRGDKPVLKGVNFTSLESGITVILGENGVGKTTLLSALAGLLPLAKGEYGCFESDGNMASMMRIGYILQKQVIFRRSVAANVDYALSASKMVIEDKRRIRDITLEMMGLSHLADKPAHRLSQGEKQKLVIARVLAMQPGILMLDEATNSLDSVAVDSLEKHVQYLAKQGLPVIWVTHNINQARRVADHVMLLQDGQVESFEPAKQFFNKVKG